MVHFSSLVEFFKERATEIKKSLAGIRHPSGWSGRLGKHNAAKE
jgi:hypothetical protein